MVRKLIIEDMQKIASERGGKCLSTKYVSAKSKLLWRCRVGHEWEAAPDGMKKRNKWCPSCGAKRRGLKRRLTIKEMQKIAKQRGGKCLSENYLNANKPLRWQCGVGHIWEATPGSVKCQKTWCPDCGRLRTLESVKKYSINDMKSLAVRRGGCCLSKSYGHYNRKLKWQCSEGHKWLATPSVVLRGAWCHQCGLLRSRRGERICRKFFELLFHKGFPSRKPSWLRLPKGSSLELDGFCESLKLAFEYQGQQHYQKSPHYFHVRQRFSKQKERDLVKERLCLAKGVQLILIPHWVCDPFLQNGLKAEYQKMESFIIRELKKLNVSILPLPPTLYEQLYPYLYQPRKLEEMRKIAASKGGKCLSSEFVGDKTKLKWVCKLGHTWETTPECVKMGSWCPECAGRPSLTIEDMHKLAREKGGECLSTKYVNNRTKLKWSCKEGHEWVSSAQSVRNNSWCPVCSRRHRWDKRKRPTLKDMQDIASRLGGRCLSDKYLGDKVKLKWRCKDGHEWDAVPSSIKQGSWCRICRTKRAADHRRLSIDEMREIAEQRRGKCLSKIYVDSQTHLEWQCEQGHIWKARPNNIKRGKWCPHCAREKQSFRCLNLI